MDTLLTPLVKDKKGDLSKSDNYRPLAITCIASKILELVILYRYEDLLVTSDNQFGFKSKHSTELCVFTLKQIIEYYRNLNSPVYLCFLDASKAFDKINHWKLFKCLIKRNLPCIILRLLAVWYTEQLFYVQWNGILSSPFNVSNGVRQGSILSPILFNVFMDDLSVLLNRSKYGCTVNTHITNHLFYADDSVLLAPTPYSLQCLLKICEQFAKEAELTYNVKKTFCMVILPKWLKHLENPTLYLDNKILNFTGEHKYLGVNICNNLTDDVDIKQQTRGTYARGNNIILKFRKCDTETKVKLFKTFCNSFYGSGLWVNYHCNVIKKLRSSYRSCFKYLLKCDRADVDYNMLTLNVDFMEVILRKAIHSLYIRIFDSQNSLISVLKNSLFFMDSPFYKKWHKLCFKKT